MRSASARIDGSSTRLVLCGRAAKTVRICKANSNATEAWHRPRVGRIESDDAHPADCLPVIRTADYESGPRPSSITLAVTALLTSRGRERNSGLAPIARAPALAVPSFALLPAYRLPPADWKMGACHHTSWLSLHGGEQMLLRRASTLRDLVARLDAPAKKWPSLVVLVGNTSDAPLMARALPAARKNAGREARKAIHLQLDPATASSDHPVFVLHGDVPARAVLEPEPAAAPCHDSTVSELRWPVGNPAEALHALYSRLIYPFADVVCLFASKHEVHCW
ncbi:hypothetical protein BS50DRAFT_261980 [Corynespora cassiicola Philippines]|uniref:Uncharacterized protein n=1 Tax=Corynespora cassiicola Philippines TaxID=1448308 RepID=A0A2T2N182_CORCC|nr:hypothetical protein BS50DRAFT_261980 [Corynespora cassiicola Philippines]